MPRLKRLKVNRYPLVRPGCDLRFNDTFNIILGLNGTGKTTLLNLISRISRWDFSELAEESFDIEYTIEHLDCTLDVHFVNQRVQDQSSTSGRTLSHRVGRSGSDFRAMFDWRLTAASGPRSAGRLIHDPRGREDFAAPIKGGQGHEIRTDLFDPSSGPFGLISYISIFDPYEDLPLATRLDEGYGLLEELLDAATYDDYPGRNFGVGGTFVLMMRQARFGAIAPIFNETQHPGLGEGITAPPPRTVEKSSQEIPFLSKFVTAMGLRDAYVSWELEDSERVDYFAGGEPRYSFIYKHPKFFFTRKDGSIFQHTRLSYGQKRFLMLLWYLSMNKDIAIIDELSNGLHHKMMEELIGDLRLRQSFLATQSPLLVDYIGFDSPKNVRRSFVLCSVQEEPHPGGFCWEQMSENEADEFFRDLETRCMHVNEILRMRGLW